MVGPSCCRRPQVPAAVCHPTTFVAPCAALPRRGTPWWPTTPVQQRFRPSKWPVLLRGAVSAGYSDPSINVFGPPAWVVAVSPSGVRHPASRDPGPTLGNPSSLARHKPHGPLQSSNVDGTVKCPSLPPLVARGTTFSTLLPPGGWPLDAHTSSEMGGSAAFFWSCAVRASTSSSVVATPMSRGVGSVPSFAYCRPLFGDRSLRLAAQLSNSKSALAAAHAG